MNSSLSPDHGKTTHDSRGHLGDLRSIPKSNYRAPLHIIGPEGQLQVHTAPYRGSFSVVLSEAIRTAGLGSRVLIAQFLRGGVSQGPKGAINLCGRLEWLRPAITQCISEIAETQDCQEEQSNALQAVMEIWEVCKKRIIAGDLDQLVLDEVGLAISLGYLKESDLIKTLEQRPKAMDVILTGPSIPSGVIAMADQITELRSGL